MLRGTINPVPASGQEPCTTNIKGLIVFNVTNKYLSVILIITHIYVFTLEKKQSHMAKYILVINTYIHFTFLDGTVIIYLS